MDINNKVLRNTIAYMQTEVKIGKGGQLNIGCIHRHILIANGCESFIGNGSEARKAMELLRIEPNVAIQLFIPENEYANYKIKNVNDPRQISIGRAINQLRVLDITGMVNWNPLAVAAALAAEKFVKEERVEKMNSVKCTAADKKILAEWIGIKR